MLKKLMRVMARFNLRIAAISSVFLATAIAVFEIIFFPEFVYIRCEIDTTQRLLPLRDGTTCPGRKTSVGLHNNASDWLGGMFPSSVANGNIIVFRPAVNASQAVDESSELCDLVAGRRIVVTYASHGKHMYQAKKTCRAAVSQPNIDVCLLFTPGFLDPVFKQQNAKILSQGRGAGYWLWKPYLILRLLLAIDEDDVLFFMDGDKKLIHNIEEFVCVQANVKQDIAVFHQAYVEYPWTKADAYLIMNVENLPLVNETMQPPAGFHLIRKSLTSIRFYSEWLTYAQDSRISTDEPSKIRPNNKFFKEHRHDQSTLSLLVKKWNIPTWPDPLKPWNHSQVFEDSQGIERRPFNSLDTKGNFKQPTKVIMAEND